MVGPGTVVPWCLQTTWNRAKDAASRAHLCPAPSFTSPKTPGEDKGEAGSRCLRPFGLAVLDYGAAFLEARV